MTRTVSADVPELFELAAERRAGPPDAVGPDGGAQVPFDNVARLAAMVLGTRLAAVTLAGERSPGMIGRSAPDVAGQLSQVGRSLCQYVIDSGARLIIEDARLDPRAIACGPSGPSVASGPDGMIAWAGFPVRGPDGRVVGALCVADDVPRQWSKADAEVLETLSHVAASEIALRVALRDGAERAALARTLQESLLPSRLPSIPGLQVAARHVAGGRHAGGGNGAEVLGDFYDVFPSVRGNWGMVVGDVCGKGVAAAKSTALARHTVRAEARRETRPSLILDALNRALLEWLTDDPRFLTAIYATVRPTLAGASVQISSAGHPLALVHRADGHVQACGRPGTLLGLFPDPELHDSQKLLRAGDSLIAFTDGVTEARRRSDRDLYGDDRLRDLLAGLGDAPAARIADAIQQSVLAFSDGDVSDDTVALVLKVPRQ